MNGEHIFFRTPSLNNNCLYLKQKYLKSLLEGAKLHLISLKAFGLLQGNFPLIQIFTNQRSLVI